MARPRNTFLWAHPLGTETSGALREECTPYACPSGSWALAMSLLGVGEDPLRSPPSQDFPVSCHGQTFVPGLITGCVELGPR